MSDRGKKESLEVSSQSLEDELVAIKDRLSAIEIIQSISNVEVVKKYVNEHLTTNKAKEIMRDCEEPRTRAYLTSKFGFKTGQALDHHLKPLREATLLREKVEKGGIVVEWSKLFAGLPKSAIRAILGEGKKAR